MTKRWSMLGREYSLERRHMYYDDQIFMRTVMWPHTHHITQQNEITQVEQLVVSYVARVLYL